MGQWQTRSVLYWGLMPLSWLYTGLVWLRRRAYQQQWLKQYHVLHPVIVIGNIFVGGTGKTPIVLALIQDLQWRGKKPGLISRGYGSSRRADGRPLVAQISSEQSSIDPQSFGDEPALIAHLTGIPIAVHHRRAKAAQALLQAHPEVDILICDDGLQHLALARDVEILVQDERNVGNGLTFPAGPLREPISRLETVDAVLTRSHVFNQIKSTASHIKPYRTQFAVKIQHFQALHQPNKTLTPESFVDMIKLHPNQSLCAMAAIGFPERFFSELKNLGLKLNQTIALPDHADIHESDFQRIKASEIVITAKDAVKLKHLSDQRIWVAHTHLTWQDSNFTEWLLTQFSPQTPTTK